MFHAMCAAMCSFHRPTFWVLNKSTKVLVVCDVDCLILVCSVKPCLIWQLHKGPGWVCLRTVEWVVLCRVSVCEGGGRGGLQEVD